MKKFNKFRLMLLVLVLIVLASGCANQKKENSTENSTTTPSTSITSEITSNSTGTTVDMDKIWKDQRANLEKEKALQEDTSIAAKVNGTPIYHWQIETTVNHNNLSLNNYRAQLDTMDLSEEEKSTYLETYKATLILNKKDILTNLIRETVIQSEISKRGLIPKDEDVLEKAEEQFANIKKTPETYQSAQLHMEVMNLTEEDYLKLIINEHKKIDGQANIYEQITEAIETKAEKDKAFNTSVDEWIAAADIQIINNQE